MMVTLDILRFVELANSSRIRLVEFLKNRKVSQVSIWGAGTNGFLTAFLLQESSIEIRCFYDKSRTGSLFGIEVRPEPSEDLEGECVIIAMDKPLRQIARIKALCSRSGIHCIHLASSLAEREPCLCISPLDQSFYEIRGRLQRSLPDGRYAISVWGCGMNGRTVVLLLLFLGYEVRLYDAKPCESIWGIDVFPEPDQLAEDEFVLIAMNGPENAVERIQRKCRHFSVGCLQIYNEPRVTGRFSLRQLHRQQKRHNMEEINALFLDPAVEVVSFDLFDTLLCRPVLTPPDLFYLVERKVHLLMGDAGFPFSKLRVRAEKEARRRLRVLGDECCEETTLSEIYEIFCECFGLSENLRDQVKALELETESKCLRRREAGGKLFELAKRSGKRIVIISDIYLPGKDVERILFANGYRGYEHCAVSAEYRQTKHSGRLYATLLNEIKVSPKAWVHVGDHVKSDVQMARSHGIRTVYLPSAVNQFWDHPAHERLWVGREAFLEPSMRMMLGIMINRYFDRPFDGLDERKDSLFNGDASQMGYCAGGPWFFFMIQWMLEETSKDKCRTLHMIARDGYVPLQVFNRLEAFYPDAPNVRYLHISRIISHAVSMRDRSSILLSHDELPVMDHVPVETLLRERFFIKQPELFRDALLEEGYKLGHPPRCYERFLMDCLNNKQLEAEIRCRLHEFQEMAEAYYKAEFEASGKHAIFDVGYTGKIHSCLERLTGMPIDGYFFSSSLNADVLKPHSLRTRNYFGAPLNERVHRFFSRGIAEHVMSDPHNGSMVNLKTSGGYIVPVWTEPNVDEYTREVQHAIQSGVLEFIDDVKEWFGNDLTLLHATPGSAFFQMNQFMCEPYARDAKIFMNVGYENGATGKGGVLIGRERALSAWATGFDAIDAVGEIAPMTLNDADSLASEKLPLNEGERRVLWIDYARVPDKYSFVRELASCDRSINYLILDAYSRAPEIDAENISLIHPPDTISCCYKYGVQMSRLEDPYVSSTLYSYAAQFHYLLRERHEVSFEQALSAVVEAYQYTCDILQKYNPSVTLIWNEFYALSRVAQFACDMMSKKTAYLEYGILPGTIQIDCLGQVGESWIAREPELFDSLEIGEEDLRNAQLALSFYRESGLNRRNQPEYGGLKQQLEGIDKPIIFLAGHNNYSSGVFPYDVNARNLHSPLFRDSFHMFEEVAGIARSNEWFVVFKPHPFSKKYLPEQRSADHYLIVDDVNIIECMDVCDLVATVLSQMSYMALIRRKAVVMMGYSPLYAKECSYEAMTIDSIANQIRRALVHEDASRMQAAWEAHVARLLKYYLYLYRVDKDESVPAQPIQEFVRKLVALAEGDIDDYGLTQTSSENNRCSCST